MNFSKAQRFALLSFLLISAITLFFGLKPQGNFKAEWVKVNQSKSAVEIGEFGYLQGSISDFSNPILADWSLEVLLTLEAKIQLDPNFRIILFIGDDCESNPFIIGQWQNQLIVMQGCDFPNKSQQPRLATNLNGHTSVPIDITLSLRNNSSALSLNHEVVSFNQEVVVNPTITNGSLLLLGNSPDGRHGWKGSVSNFEIHRIKNDKSKSNNSAILQSYSFSAQSETTTFPDQQSEHNYLEIPKIGKFPDAVILERFPIARLWKTERTDVLLNFFGFAPFGLVTAMFLYSWLGFNGIRMVALSFVAAVLLSLSIELAQVTIAGRRSALHDLMLNSAGAIPGIAAFAFFLTLRSIYLRVTTATPTNSEKSVD